MTTSSTDLRYGRRGGRWVPPDRQRETRRPDLFERRPCPEFSCRGDVLWPRAKQTEPYTVGPCDGPFQHTTRLTPLAPHFPPKETRP